MKKSNLIFWGSVLVFLTNGFAVQTIIKLQISIDNLIQILAISIILIIFTTRVIFPKFQKTSPKLAYFFEFAPLSLFVYLLIFSTGGLASPFLVLTHIFAIGMAFLISLQVSILYVIVTIAFLIINLFSDPTAQMLLTGNLFVVLVYLLAYIAIVPFSLHVATTYRQKEEWVEKLTEQIATSRSQEETLLKNIADAVLILNKQSTISYTNQAFEDLTNYNLNQIFEKNFFEVFEFKDKDGGDLESFNLPIQEVVKTKNQAEIDEFQILEKNGDFLRVSLKILPLIDQGGQILGTLLIFAKPGHKGEKAKPEEALSSLSQLLKNSNKELRGISQEVQKSKPDIGQKLQNISSLQDQAAEFVEDISTLLKIEAEVISGLSKFLDVSKIFADLIYHYRQSAKNFGVKIVCTQPEEENSGKMARPASSKEKVEDCFFKPAFNLVNEELLTTGIKKLIKVAILLAEDTKVVRVDLQPATNLIKIEFHVPNRSYQYGNGTNEFINIQVALAEKIFEYFGGGLKIERSQKELVFLTTLARQSPKQSEN